MNREAQILQALQGELPLAARKALVVELNSIRSQAARRVATAREVELGKEAAAAHLTPAPTYVRHTTDTDWLGKVGSVRQAPAEIHQQAKSEAGAWMRQVSALARADHEELRIQAVGYAQVWGSQFGELATVARDSFLQTASHLAGVKLAADDEDEPKDDDESDDSDEAYTEAEDDSDGGNPFANDDDEEEGSKKEARRVVAARPLYEIARDIRRDWGSNVNYAAQPYLDAMRELDSINDRYYEDTAKSIVAYFLSNASSWRGETAKAIKAELKAMMSGKSAVKIASLDDVQRWCDRNGLVMRDFPDSLISEVAESGDYSALEAWLETNEPRTKNMWGDSPSSLPTDQYDFYLDSQASLRTAEWEAKSCARCGGNNASGVDRCAHCGAVMDPNPKRKATRVVAEADGIDSPSPDSQNGYAESTLPDVTPESAPEDTNLGWISEGDPNADNAPNGTDTPITASLGVFEAMFMGGSFEGVPDSTKSMYADKETFPCGLCGKPATHYAYQEGSRASGTFACDGCIQYFAPGRIVVDASRKSAGLYPDENAAGVTTWADGYGTWHATADSAEEARAAIERELVARGEIDPQNYEVFVTLVDGRHYVESSPERPEVVSSRKHAEADGIDSPSPESQNGYAESTLPNVEVATAPEDTNLGWIADGDPNAEPEGSFEAPDNPIANEASRHTAANDNWSVEVTRSMTGNLVFTVFNDPTDPDHFAYGVHEPVASFSSFAAANAYIVRRGGTPVLERATQANEASLNARFARLVEAGENDRPAGAAPMVDQVTDDAEDDTDMFGGEWVHEGQRRQAVHPDDDPSQGPGYANDAPNMLGDPPGMDPEDYDMFAPELPKQARKITSAVKTEVVDGLPYPESGGKFKTPCVVVGHKGRIQLIASPSYVEDLPVSTLDEAIGHVLRRVQENAEMLGTTEYTLYVYRDSRTASLKTAMPAPADLGINVGDIFYNSWGYDQTNIDYYKVVRLTPAGVEIVPIGKKYVERNGPGGDQVVPDPDSIREWDTITGIERGGKGSKVCRIKGDGGRYGPYIVLNDRHSATRWNGRPDYQTDSMFGH